MGTPARPDLVFNSIDELLADAARLRDGGHEQLGKWTLAMILDHLGKAMNGPWSDQSRVPWPFSIGARALIHRMVQRDRYPNFTFPVPPGMKPSKTVSLADANAAFCSAAEKVKACTGPVVENTPFGTLPLHDFVKMHLLHGAHHLGFLKPT